LIRIDGLAIYFSFGVVVLGLREGGVVMVVYSF